MSIDAAKLAACQELVRSCAVPILACDDRKFGIEGTGTLFRMGSLSLLVTAAHVAELIKSAPGRMALPLTRGNVCDFVDFTGCTVLCPRESALPFNADAGVVVLHEREQVQRLERSWTFLSDGNLGLVPQESGSFLVAGYPASLSRTDESGLSLVAEMLCFRSTEFTDELGDCKTAPNDQVDLFLRHDKALLTDSGLTVETPALRGMSGASVWAMGSHESEGHIWTPEADLKIVGVQVSCKPGQWVRAVRWGIVAVVLAKAAKESLSNTMGSG
ncbi:MAG: hypothetical protein FJ109_07220 [Deltaproteobacteria bacterium]|nr:hypothetical protein [Deltaproteobacteria bacterium]